MQTLIKQLQERLEPWQPMLAEPIFRYLFLVLALGLALDLGQFAGPTPPRGESEAGLPTVSIVELQLAGTRDTAINALRNADLLALKRALAWDIALILAYAAGLYFGLQLFAAALARQGHLLDTAMPVAALVAALLDAAQNLLLALELHASLAAPPWWLDWVPGVVASLTLANWTLVIMAGTHLAWLVLIDARRLWKRML